jgi:hypothetical protein
MCLVSRSGPGAPSLGSCHLRSESESQSHVAYSNVVIFENENGEGNRQHVPRSAPPGFIGSNIGEARAKALEQPMDVPKCRTPSAVHNSSKCAKR